MYTRRERSEFVGLDWQTLDDWYAHRTSAMQSLPGLPVLILTVIGRSTCAAMPATIFASLVGLRSRAAPRPLLVASGWGQAAHSGGQREGALVNTCAHALCLQCYLWVSLNLRLLIESAWGSGSLRAPQRGSHVAGPRLLNNSHRLEL